MTKLWVDDKREPPEGWIWAQSALETIDRLNASPRFSVISLDYDLGDWDNNGVTVLEWLGEHPDKWPTEAVRCHSGSSSGRGLLVEAAKKHAPAEWLGRITNTGGF